VKLIRTVGDLKERFEWCENDARLIFKVGKETFEIDETGETDGGESITIYLTKH
jgi:hypothetical protein